MVRFILTNKNAQMWGFDLFVAMSIFFIGIIIFYFYSLNQTGDVEENFDNLFYDGDIIFSNILSSGVPKEWNKDNVVIIGVLDDGKINESKLGMFYEMTVSDYGKTKRLFNTRYNYYFFLSNKMSIDSQEIEGIGMNFTSAKNLIKITRFTIYKEKPITAYLYVWEGK